MGSGLGSDGDIGNVFEKRLIEAYIAENGKDPVNGEELSTDDLVELQSARVVRPRPPTLTSIPSLLSVFQNEWDALALETYTLKQQLAQTRQELSTALYQHDAAVRVIARVIKERDEARDALSKVTVSAGGATSTGDQMQIDSAGLPESISAKIDETQSRYSILHAKLVASLLTYELDSRRPGVNAQHHQAGSLETVYSPGSPWDLLDLSTQDVKLLLPIPPAISCSMEGKRVSLEYIRCRNVNSYRH
jgi:hypothetical protein